MSRDEAGREPLGVVRLAIWCLVPVVEALGLSFAFDFGVFWEGIAGAPWWRPIVLQAGQAPRIAIAAALAALIHGGFAWKDELAKMGGDLAWSRGLAARIAAHLAALAAFVGLTARLVGPDPSARSGGLMVSLWAVAGLLAAATWLAIALPPSRWGGFARRRGGSLLIGLAIGGLAWAAGVATSMLWRPMAAGTFALVRLMLRPVFGSSLRLIPERRIMGTDRFLIEIAPDCAGYEGIGLVWVILGAYLWIARRDLRFPRALVLLPLGTALIWLTNAVRIALLVAIGAWVSPKVAIGGFHSQAGWLALNAVTLGLIAASRRIGWMTRGVEPTAEGRVENPSAAYLVPLMALVSMMMIGSALSVGFDRFYFLRVVAVSATLWTFRSSYREPMFSGSLASVGLGLMVLATWLALEPRSGPAGEALVAGLAALPTAWRVGWIALKVVGSTLLVPIAEELAFRGFLMRRLASIDFEAVDPRRVGPAPILVSSLLFGAMHQRFVAGTLAGLIFAYAYRRRGRIGDAILAHAVANGCIAALAVVGGMWSLWA